LSFTAVSALAAAAVVFGAAPAGAQSCSLQADHLLSFDGVLATNLFLPEGCDPEVYRLVVQALPPGVAAGTPLSLDEPQITVAIIDRLVGSEAVLFDPGAINSCGVELQLDYGKLSLPGWDTFRLGVSVTGAVSGPEAAQFEHAVAACAEAVVPMAPVAPVQPAPVAHVPAAPVVEAAGTQAVVEAPVAVLAAQASRADQIGVPAGRQGGLPVTGGGQRSVAVLAITVIFAGLVLLLVTRRTATRLIP
jgi:hypothetical protein